jgi:hypothetical protein
MAKISGMGHIHAQAFGEDLCPPQNDTWAAFVGAPVHVGWDRLRDLLAVSGFDLDELEAAVGVRHHRQIVDRDGFCQPEGNQHG